MRYPVYLEVGSGGSTLAFVFALPGVSVRARSPEAALAALPGAVAAERARLAAAGRAWPGDGVIDIAEAERIAVAGDPVAAGSTALFRYELRPTRDEDVALVLDSLALSREEIARALGLSTGGESAPLADAPFADAPLAGARAAAALVALADGEWWLLSRLGNRPAAVLPPESEPWARCEAVRALTIERLTHLLPGDIERHAVFGGEPWTTRKVLRRLACHAREAALGVQALGAAPDVAPDVAPRPAR